MFTVSPVSREKQTHFVNSFNYKLTVRNAVYYIHLIRTFLFALVSGA